MNRYFVILYSCLILFFVGSRDTFALVPLESLILGDMSENYVEEKNDPIRTVFQLRDEESMPYDEKKHLSLYRGLIQEGLNTVDSCQFNKGIHYPTMWDGEQVKRALFAQMQYMAIDTTVRALAQYAKYFELSDEEYEKWVDSLIGNYCSQNLTVIGLKELKKNFLVKFQKENNFILPNISKNSLFPKYLDDAASERKIKEHELYQTMRIFRGHCSWGGESDNTRMLVPFLKNPFIYSYVARTLAGLSPEWNMYDNRIRLKQDNSLPSVYCSNLICRRVQRHFFNRKFPHSVGGDDTPYGIYHDLQRLYCQEFRDMDYQTKNQVPEISEWIKKESFDDEILMTGQYLALISGVPEFLLRPEKFNELQQLTRYSVDKSWNQWSVHQLKNYNKLLYFEESLSLEKVERRLYFNPYVDKFSVVFDINLGETDRVNQIVGKVSAVINLKVTHTFLSWIRREWIELDPRQVGRREHLVRVFVRNIEDQVKNFRQKFVVAPWDGNLSELIARDLLDQLESYKGSSLNHPKKGDMTIPIHFNYGLYALKHLNFEFNLGITNQKDQRPQDSTPVAQ